MEDIKALVDGYCQITGRPAFTITVDEFIKFHQLSRFRSPLSSPTTEKVVEKENPVVPSVAKQTPSEETKAVRTAEENPSTATVKEDKPKPEPKPVISETKTVPTKETPVKNNIALEMLKSIKG